MRDFTFQIYRYYLLALQKNYRFLRFCDYMNLKQELNSFCIIRHDVDRNPENALKMAKVEYKMGIPASYYFRIKKISFKPNIIRKINRLGHEIGYHYEELSDTCGDHSKSYRLFEKNLEKMRELTPIRTIAMHGNPLSGADNRDLWRSEKSQKKLKGEYNISGEVYLNCDYSKIAYINDTGRNWTSQKSNIRDHVLSNMETDFNSKEDLLEALNNKKYDTIVFQIHPERWEDNLFRWMFVFAKDMAINLTKHIVKFVK